MQIVNSLKDEGGNRLKPHVYVKSEHGILEKCEKVLDPRAITRASITLFE